MRTAALSLILMIFYSSGMEQTSGAVTFNGSVSPNPTTTTLSDPLIVGFDADGEMQIDGGSTVQSSTGDIGRQALSASPITGTATIDGPGSAWEMSGSLRLGISSSPSSTVSGVLAISNGGTVTSVGGQLAGPSPNPNASASVSITGQDSTWSSSSSVFFGRGTLSIGDGGFLDVSAGNLVFLGTLNTVLGSPSDSFLSAAGFANVGGTVDIDLEVGYVPIANDVFQILSASSYAGNPTFDFDDAVLPTGLDWNTDMFLVDGTISVESVFVESADFDEDGDVDLADVLTLQRNFGLDAGGGNTAPLADGNANGDQFVNGDDLAVWYAQFGTGELPVAAATAVPEPSVLTLVLGLVAGCGMPRRCAAQKRGA